MPTKAPGTSRPPRRPRGDFILFCFSIFKLHIKTLPYLRRVSTGQACGGRGAGSPRAPGSRALLAAPPARPRACALNQWLKEEAPTEGTETPELPPRRHGDLHRERRGMEHRPCRCRVAGGDGADGARCGDARAPTPRADALAAPSLPKYKGLHVKGPQQGRLPIKALPLTNSSPAARWFLLSRFHVSVHWRGTKPGS